MQKEFSAEQLVNMIGKYANKHIDGAYKIKFTPGVCDIYMTMFYQTHDEEDTFSEMNFNINITSYSNKIRINITEIDEMEKTIGQDIYPVNKVQDIQASFPMIYSKICDHIKKEYSEYDFVF